MIKQLLLDLGLCTDYYLSLLPADLRTWFYSHFFRRLCRRPVMDHTWSELSWKPRQFMTGLPLSAVRAHMYNNLHRGHKIRIKNYRVCAARYSFEASSLNVEISIENMNELDQWLEQQFYCEPAQYLMEDWHLEPLL